MGIAVIIPNVNYGDANLGKVTLQQGVPLRSMTIVGPDEITEPTLFTVNFFPANTSQRGIVWSIVSGGTYASINAETGELTPIVGAVLNDVVIRATSSADSDIYAEKTVTVSYGMVYIEKKGLVGDGAAMIRTNLNLRQNHKVIYKYKINSYPTATSTTKYFSLWVTYSGESAPLARHLVSWVANPSISFVRQNVSFGRAEATSTTTGFSATNKKEYPNVGQIYENEVSIDGFNSSYSPTDWERYQYGPFHQPVNAIRLFGVPNSGVAMDMTYYKFQVKDKDNDTLYLNLVPCTLAVDIDSSLAGDEQAHIAGENGMWDKVGNKFYGNGEASGSFSVID